MVPMGVWDIGHHHWDVPMRHLPRVEEEVMSPALLGPQGWTQHWVDGTASAQGWHGDTLPCIPWGGRCPGDMLYAGGGTVPACQPS